MYDNEVGLRGMQSFQLDRSHGFRYYTGRDNAETLSLTGTSQSHLDKEKGTKRRVHLPII